MVADSFLEGGEIVSTRGKTTDQNEPCARQAGDITNGKKVVVLINGAPSASEIVAGALQDQERATIVGTRTFGKGSCSRIFQMRCNFALKLTTQLYNTPSGPLDSGQGHQPGLHRAAGCAGSRARPLRDQG